MIKRLPLLALLGWLALAGPLKAQEDVVTAEGLDQTTCKVVGVGTREGLLVIRCETATPDGVRVFALDRQTRRHDDTRDFATASLEQNRPLVILYMTDPSRNPRGCDLQTCRQIYGVERR